MTDNGIFRPGLWALAEVANRFGEVFAVAPDMEQSGVGHTTTIALPLAGEVPSGAGPGS